MSGGLLGRARDALLGAPATEARRTLQVATNEPDEAGLGPHTNAEIMALQRTLELTGTVPTADMSRLMEHYMPTTELTYHDDGGRPLQASTVRGMRSQNKKWAPPFAGNPRQGMDYFMIDTGATMTIMQALINVKMRLIMGTGFEPELYLKKPTAEDVTEDDGDDGGGRPGGGGDGDGGDSERATSAKDRAKAADAKRLKELEWVTDVMKAVDRRVGMGDRKVKRVPVQSQFTSLVRNMVVYNRAALIKQPGAPLEVDGHEYTGLPGGLAFVHPKDLGLVKVDDNGDMEGVMWQWGGLLNSDEIIYLWNSYQGEERPGLRWYGLSMMDGCMAVARQIFRYDTEVVPIMIRASYSGAAIVSYRAPGATDAERAVECERLAMQLKPGTLCVAAADPLEIEVHPINIEPKLHDTVEHKNQMIKELCTAAEIPYSVIFDESASNRATLTGKLIYTTATVVEPFRQWLDLELTPQWYGEMLEVIAEEREMPELLDEVGVRLKWDSMNLEADEELTTGMQQLTQMVPLTDEAILRECGRGDLIKDIDPEKVRRRDEMADGGMMGDEGGPQSMDIEDRDSGRKFKVK